MRTRDTSHHEVRHGESVTTSIKNGPASSNDSMPSAPQHHSIRPGSPDGKYVPTTIDPERTDYDAEHMHDAPC